MATTQTKLAKETVRVGKFGLVGIVNTLLDFSIYNLLIFYLSFTVIPANIISTTIAMVFSFIANKTFVFRSKSTDILAQAVLFLTVTAFGLYIIQNAVIYTLTELFTWPLETAYQVVKVVGLDTTFSMEFVIKNGAKAVATLFSLTWNYILYKKIVFKK